MKLCTLLTQGRFVLHVENLNYLVVKRILYKRCSSLLEAGLCLCKQKRCVQCEGALGPPYGKKSWQANLRLVRAVMLSIPKVNWGTGGSPELPAIWAQVQVISLLLFLKKCKSSVGETSGMVWRAAGSLGGLSLCGCVPSCGWRKNSKRKGTRQTVVRVGAVKV